MKKMVLILVLFLVAAGLFAELSVGATASYSISSYVLDSVEEILIGPENLLYGVFAELQHKKVGLGLQYAVDYGTIFQDGMAGWVRTSDLSVFLTLRAFKPRSFIDPFIEAGYGKNMRDSGFGDYSYLYGGAGLGVNLYYLGAFVKLLYAFPLNDQGSQYRAVAGVKLIL